VWAIHPATGQIEALVPEELLWPRPQRLSVSPDGRYVALADTYGKVSVWDALEQRIALQFQAHEEVKATIAAISGIVWLPDGRRLMTVGNSGEAGQSTEQTDSRSFKHTTIKLWQIMLS
jgi:hypothetical protein